MFTERGHGLIRWGVVLIALSVLSGFAIPHVAGPVLGLATHVQGLLNAFMLILIGLIWSRVEIGYLGSVVAYWGLIAGGFVTFGVQLACTFLEIGGTVFPIVGAGHVGTPAQETIVRITIEGVSVVTTLAVLLVARGVLKKPAI